MAEALLEGFALPPLSPSVYAGNVVSLDERRDDPGHEAVAAAERAVAAYRFADALEQLHRADGFAGNDLLAFKALLLSSWASLKTGALDDALRFAELAHDLSTGAGFGEVDRAEALYRQGCARFKLAQTASAASLLTMALQLCEGSDLPSDRLRTNCLAWRSRCSERQRDWHAARADVERALELAGQLDDPDTVAHAYLRASVIAERTADYRLARFYAEEAEAIYRGAGDLVMLARILNNLGGLLFLLGDEAGAIARLEEARATAGAAGSDADVAQATSSLAQIHLRCDRPAAAEEQARGSLATLLGRTDFLEEVGNIRLVLGRALLAQGRFEETREALVEAERTFRQLGSQSHLAAVWIAQGDAAGKEGDCVAAAALYRHAAESLQDFHF